MDTHLNVYPLPKKKKKKGTQQGVHNSDITVNTFDNTTNIINKNKKRYGKIRNSQ